WVLTMISWLSEKIVPLMPKNLEAAVWLFFVPPPLLNPILVSSFTTESIESLIIDIHFSSPNSSLSFHSIRICLIYRAPSCSSTSLDTFLTFIEPLIGTAPFIMCGDLNFPAIDWHTLTSPTQNDFLSFVSDHRMTQYVDFKTRGENILDLVLSNSHIVSNVRPSLPFADHTSISFSLGIPSPPPREFIPSRFYHLADWNSINYHIALRAHQVKIESRIVESKNPKAFFSLCNTRLKACKSVPLGIIDVDGTQLLSCRDKASAFSKYFASVSTSPLQSPLPSHSPPLNTPLFDLPFISISQILIAISSLAPKCNLSPKDLGIIMNPSLKFTDHISRMVSKARAKINIMFKCFFSPDPHLYNRAFTTFIRTLLEYGSVVWSPHTVILANQIEDVQRNFSRRLFARCQIPYSLYPDRISLLSLQTLEHRRFISDILFLYKSIHGFYSYDHSNLFRKAPLTRFLRRSHNLRISLPFVPPKSHSSFVIRVIERWNVLDAEIVTSSPHIFRSHILSIPSISFSEESLLRL
ncbi:hypothetical protein PENTCL1PPCAC_8110, partial [Pristionchus entomophagus]